MEILTRYPLSEWASTVAEQRFRSTLRRGVSWSSPAAHVPDTWPWQRGRVRVEPPPSRPRLAERFHGLCVALVRRLPFGLGAVIAPTVLGFLVINSFTFGVDLLLLSGLHAALGIPLLVAVTVAYASAFTLSYYLNRTMNFRSHAPVGSQFAVYVAVVAVNYLAFILGVSGALTALGMDFRLSRILAGACEAIYMYSAMRWIVFRR